MNSKYYCYYSVLRKGAKDMERSGNTSCYAQWVHLLSKVDRVVVHLALTHPQEGSSILKYSKKEVFRYLRALQRAGFKFTFSANNQMPKLEADCYGKPLPDMRLERDTICYNIDIDLIKCSHMNAQIVMFCVRFLHEKTAISDAFLRFLDDDLKAKKKSGVAIFDKMLIAMMACPGSGHSFGSYSKYNLLLGKEEFKRLIADNPIKNAVTSNQLPKSKEVTPGVYSQIRELVYSGKAPFEQVLKLYKEECVKYM